MPVAHSAMFIWLLASRTSERIFMYHCFCVLIETNNLQRQQLMAAVVLMITNWTGAFIARNGLHIGHHAGRQTTRDVASWRLTDAVIVVRHTSDSYFDIFCCLFRFTFRKRPHSFIHCVCCSSWQTDCTAVLECTSVQTEVNCQNVQ